MRRHPIKRLKMLPAAGEPFERRLFSAVPRTTLTEWGLRINRHPPPLSLPPTSFGCRLIWTLARCVSNMMEWFRQVRANVHKLCIHLPPKKKKQVRRSHQAFRCQQAMTLQQAANRNHSALDRNRQEFRSQSVQLSGGRAFDVERSFKFHAIFSSGGLCAQRGHRNVSDQNELHTVALTRTNCRCNTQFQRPTIQPTAEGDSP